MDDFKSYANVGIEGGIISPSSTTINQAIYDMCKYIKEHAKQGHSIINIQCSKVNTLGYVDYYNLTVETNEPKTYTFTFTVTNGEKGESATIEIGEVTTLPAGSQATVENVGTNNNAVFNFGIPKGEKGDAGGQVVIDIGEVTLTEISFGKYSMLKSGNISVNTEQAAQAQAETPPVVKCKLDGVECEFYRTKISQDASSVYVSFNSAEDVGESTLFYNVEIIIPRTSGEARATIIAWKYGIFGGLNNIYEMGGITFEKGVATKALSEEEASLFGGEAIYNQINFWDTNEPNDIYSVYVSYNRRSSPINTHKCDYFGIVSRAGGLTVYIAYLEDTTFTIKQVTIGS